MQASRGQLKKRLNSKTFPSEAPVKRELKLYQCWNLMEANISADCLGLKKQPHLVILAVDTAATNEIFSFGARP